MRKTLLFSFHGFHGSDHFEKHYFCSVIFSGNHKVSVKYGGVHAPGSPFNVAISPKSDVSKVRVTGPGVEPTGVQPVKPTYFTIHASEAGKGDVHVKVEPVSKYLSVLYENDFPRGFLTLHAQRTRRMRGFTRSLPFLL